MNNPILTLLSKGLILPPGQGFPLLPASIEPKQPLRQTLMFMSDQEGSAHLCRWYHSIIRATPPVWNALGGGSETYKPSKVLLAPLDSPTLELRPVDGLLSCDWKPGPGHPDAVVWQLYFNSNTVQIKAGSWAASLATSTSGDNLVVGWPEWMGMRLAFPSETLGYHALRIRPRSFDMTALVSGIQQRHLDELHAAGLLSHWHSAPWAWQKLAVAWLACSRLPETEYVDRPPIGTPVTSPPPPVFEPLYPDPGMMFVYDENGKLIYTNDGMPVQILIES